MKAITRLALAAAVAFAMPSSVWAGDPAATGKAAQDRGATEAPPIGVNEPGVNRAAATDAPIGVNEPGVNRSLPAKGQGSSRGYVVGKGGVAREAPPQDAGGTGAADPPEPPEPR